MPPASISLFLTVVLLATGHVVAPPGTSPEEAAQLKTLEAVAGEAVEHSELSDEVSEEPDSTVAVLGEIVKALHSIGIFSQGMEEFSPERKQIMDIIVTSLDHLMDLLNNITVPEAEQRDKQAVEEYLMKSMVPLVVALHEVLEPLDFDMKAEEAVGKFLVVEALDHLGKLLDKVSENSSYIMELKTLVTRMKEAANFHEPEKKIVELIFAEKVGRVATVMRQLTSELYGNGTASYAEKIRTLAGTMNDPRLDGLLNILEDTEEHIPSNTTEPETPAAEIKEAAQSQTLNEEAVAKLLVEKLTQLAHLVIPENLEDSEERIPSSTTEPETTVTEKEEDSEDRIPSSTTEPETTVAEKEDKMRQILLNLLDLHFLESDSKEFTAERMLHQNIILEHLDALIKEAAIPKTPAKRVVKKELEFILKSWDNISEIKPYFESAQDYLQELLKVSGDSDSEQDSSEEEAESTEAVLAKIVKALVSIVKFSQDIEEFDPQRKAFADNLLISLNYFMDLLRNITEAEQTDKQAVEEYLMKSMVSLTDVLHAVLEPIDSETEVKKAVGKFLVEEALDHLGKLLDKVSENSSYIMELKTLVTRMKEAAKFLESEKKLMGQFMYAEVVRKIVEEMRQLTSEIYGNGIASYSKKIETLAGTMNDTRLDLFLQTLTHSHVDQPPESKTKEAAQSQTFNETYATFLVEKLAQLAHLLIPEDSEDAEESIPNNTTEPATPVAEMNGQMRQALLDVLGLHVLDSDSKEFSGGRMLHQSDTLEHLDALIKEAAQYKNPESVVEEELEFILESWNNIAEIESYFEPAQVYLQELRKVSGDSDSEQDSSEEMKPEIEAELKHLKARLHGMSNSEEDSSKGTVESQTPYEPLQRILKHFKMITEEEQPLSDIFSELSRDTKLLPANEAYEFFLIVLNKFSEDVSGEIDQNTTTLLMYLAKWMRELYEQSISDNTLQEPIAAKLTELFAGNTLDNTTELKTFIEKLKEMKPEIEAVLKDLMPINHETFNYEENSLEDNEEDELSGIHQSTNGDDDSGKQFTTQII